LTVYAHAHSIKNSLIEALWHGQTAVTLSVILCFPNIIKNNLIAITLSEIVWFYCICIFNLW